jgi:hypothetical protein
MGYEGELGRVIIELGMIGGLIFFGLKLWILWMTWSAMGRAQTPFEDVISITAFVIAFLHLMVEMVVFNHIGGATYWLCAGAAAWVWSRRDEVPITEHARSPTVHATG